MFAALFGKRSTTKADVVMALVAAATALWKAYDTVNDYKVDNQVKEISK